jgi:AcrR family transcriptional regulator
VLRAAVRVADEGGIEAVTMRWLADELGAEAMSLYYHVANKEDILDGVVDVHRREDQRRRRSARRARVRSGRGERDDLGGS